LDLQHEGGKRDGNGDGDEDAAVDDDGDDVLTSNDPCRRKHDARCKFPI
jgi:hypothetical protein